jgi:Tfp pilus assembly protein PilF
MSKAIGMLLGCALVVFCGAPRAEDEQAAAYQSSAIASGDYVTAEHNLQSILAKDPNDPYALLNLAFVYQKSGQAAKAREMYQRILEQRQNPLAESPQGRSRPVKAIAQRGIESLPR